MTYYEWVAEEAQLIHSDGCSGVTNAWGICCAQHDLEFFYSKSASDAYRHRRRGRDAWRAAAPVTFEEANAHFRACHFRESALGHWNPWAWVRYAVVRRKKGRAAWEKHRARERG